MLEYSKMILEKVSFDNYIFEKELSKAVKRISTDEISSLEAWINDNFSDRYPQVIDRIFRDKRRAAHRRRHAVEEE